MSNLDRQRSSHLQRWTSYRAKVKRSWSSRYRRIRVNLHRAPLTALPPVVVPAQLSHRRLPPWANEAVPRVEHETLPTQSPGLLHFLVHSSPLLVQTCHQECAYTLWQFYHHTLCRSLAAFTFNQPEILFSPRWLFCCSSCGIKGTVHPQADGKPEEKCWQK